MRILAFSLCWLSPLPLLLLAPVPNAYAQTPPPHPALHAAVAAADSMVEAAITQGVIPGAEMVIAVNGTVLQDRAFGFAQLNDFDLHRLASPRPMDSTTLFDLASVTKVMATTFAMMILVDQGRLNVDAPPPAHAHGGARAVAAIVLPRIGPGGDLPGHSRYAAAMGRRQRLPLQ